ncbi:MAG TPA: response regulator [Terriglobales bacterium]|jgi:CheY-like chemotaxis protein|nr:response regulator [Terriglobales bacterium]
MLEAGKTVLVVDDVESKRYVVCRILREANYETLEAGTGAEAIQRARQHRPDAIVLDMNLPDQSGLATLQQLRDAAETALIPVVFLSAEAQSLSDRTRAEALGASGYLFSPVPPDTLIAVIRGIIERGVQPRM